MFSLRCASPFEWAPLVVSDMDTFLPDHAAAEKKASAMAMSMVVHYPDQQELVRHLTDVALEELVHFRDVIRIMQSRQLVQVPDTRDEYVQRLRQYIRKPKQQYMLDRLLIAGIIEARGAERFGLVRDHLPRHTAEEEKLYDFYRIITRSEEKHQNLFIELALHYFSENEVTDRLDILLDQEATVLLSLPLRCALH
jgi:tRNA-(ms[2]io[6]A)-hydroxylase